ncbi:hypothetical protein IscW_ISCW019570 [Ixodes scapularis]|uniref:Uncharacterized protein n=1 Tax=Ixodes scapularis TaxID=6945 RepID=B7PTZ7_IXOSC|nr:hypothetical protein IscW_ISCW019570 [Ixodes scapularis]|eukprot:XP_002405191.1 hypothetical protein IscW_ISCW019570 [Ixodes scapularis]
MVRHHQQQQLHQQLQQQKQLQQQATSAAAATSATTAPTALPPGLDTKGRPQRGSGGRQPFTRETVLACRLRLCADAGLAEQGSSSSETVNCRKGVEEGQEVRRHSGSRTF